MTDNEHQPIHKPGRVFLATADYYATGEGLDLYFVAAVAADEAEFRRVLLTELGRALASRATIKEGADASVPFKDLFVGYALQRKLEGIAAGRIDDGGVRYVARHHTNYS